MNINQLVAYEVVGNFHSDEDALAAAHNIVVNRELHIAERIMALRQIDRIMGIDAEYVPRDRIGEHEPIEVDVHDYCTEGGH